jgi:hypothetical protein
LDFPILWRQLLLSPLLRKLKIGCLPDRAFSHLMVWFTQHREFERVKAFMINTRLIKFVEEKLLIGLSSMVGFNPAFCHFLVLIQESNQRKSRKNNASPLKLSLSPLFFQANPPSDSGYNFQQTLLTLF